jgi:hypothetical protein
MKVDDWWPSVPQVPDPLPEAAHSALRDARVQLWADLWAKTERVEQVEFILDEVSAILKDAPRTHRTRRLERRVERLRGEL